VYKSIRWNSFAKIKSVPFQGKGIKGNMHKGFIGDIATFDKPGLGVYVEPILELAKEYVSEEKVKDLRSQRTSANI
jgi:uncharacterized protein YvpB